MLYFKENVTTGYINWCIKINEVYFMWESIICLKIEKTNGKSFLSEQD